ncbi:MAG: AMP-binding protein [Deltaproteobacteria bacterium]|jgi:acyl-CoA synthetase (AMP-forming)/AMP-acid ligase II|nr:AMP-binding protein [Deltaproteobacteria bacterium]
MAQAASGSDQDVFNIAQTLTAAAAVDPDRLAVIARHLPDSRGRTVITYAQLAEDSSRLAGGLLANGFEKGDRVVVMVPMGLDFYITVFALFKAGLVPVMVDPGMGLRRMLLCLSEGRPRGLIGIPLALVISFLCPKYFRGIKKRAAAGRFPPFCGVKNLARLLTNPPLPEQTCLAQDTAAVLFTSGATGPAKGAVYTHSMFRAQVESIRQNFGMNYGGVDMATFPLFALFAPALGLTSVIPNMNPIKPGQADPKKLIQSLVNEKCTSLFGSPALLKRLAVYGQEQKITLAGVRRIITAGAPVQPALAAEMASLLEPGASLVTPYGATEGMPLTTVDAEEIAGARGMTEQGFGMCVGRPLPGISLAILPITDQPLDSFKSEKILPMGEVGEITASGPVICRGYFERPKETAMTLLTGPDGEVWRRMGDLGWVDAMGRLWFCGRKSQRVVTEQGTLFTVCCESIFNNHPRVRRSALVGTGPAGRQKPVMVIEPNTRLSRAGWKALVEELKRLGSANPRTRTIEVFLRHKNFPVDIRHNAKISREKLAVWAAKNLEGDRE